MAAKKEEIYRSLLGSKAPIIAAGVRGFLDTLSKNDVWPPEYCALVVEGVQGIVKNGSGGFVF